MVRTKYRVNPCLNRKKHHLGYFHDFDEALKVLNDWKSIHHVIRS
jgi:hypothetical protein